MEYHNGQPPAGARPSRGSWPALQANFQTSAYSTRADASGRICHTRSSSGFRRAHRRRRSRFHPDRNLIHGAVPFTSRVRRGMRAAIRRLHWPASSADPGCSVEKSGTGCSPASWSRPAAPSRRSGAREARTAPRSTDQNRMAASENTAGRPRPPVTRRAPGHLLVDPDQQRPPPAQRRVVAGPVRRAVAGGRWLAHATRITAWIREENPSPR